MQQQAFWDRAARRYAKRPIGDPAAYEKTLDRVRAHLAPDARVLELGCGTGSTALLLAPSVAHYTGTDISAEMIAIAREKPAPDHVDFEQAEVLAHGTPGAFDTVLAFNLFHLLDDIPAALAHVHGLLPPGGMFMSKTACLASKRWLFGPLIGAMRLIGKAPPVQMLSTDRIEQMIRTAGFDILETGDYPVSPPSRLVIARRP